MSLPKQLRNALTSHIRTFVLYLDGKEVARGAWLDLVTYIHRNHCYSFQHACDHEGYSWKEVES